MINNLLCYISIMSFAIFCGCKGPHSNPSKPETIIKVLEAKLAPGTPYAEVESYLKDSNIEYSYDNKARCFQGIVRNVKTQSFVSQNISIIAKMDDKDVVKELEIKPINTGP